MIALLLALQIAAPFDLTLGSCQTGSLVVYGVESCLPTCEEVQVRAATIPAYDHDSSVKPDDLVWTCKGE